MHRYTVGGGCVSFEGFAVRKVAFGSTVWFGVP